jgi:hypothetical protein
MMVPSVTLTGLLGGLLVLTTASTNYAASDLNTVQDRPAATGQQISAGMIEIDGAKNPEAIPEYLAWTLGLSGLSIIKRNNIVTAIEELGLSPADAALAFAEGERQGKRDQECSSRTRPIAESMRGQRGDKIEAALRPEILKCRWAVLDAKDSLLSSMTPEGRVALTAWVLAGRKDIKSLVPKEDLEFFRQPK